MDRDHGAWVAAIVQAINAGTPLDLAPGETKIYPDLLWPTSRKLPGKALRAALLHPDIKPDPRGLRIRAAYITGEADLKELRTPFSLFFFDCRFQRPVDWRRISVSGVMHLARCVGSSFNFDGADIKGEAVLSNLTATRTVSARDASIGGHLDLRHATLTNKGGEALNLDRVRIKGGAFLGRLTVTGEVRAVLANIGGELNLERATLTNKGGNALTLDAAEIKGGALLGHLTATGSVRTINASIGGNLDLDDADLSNESGYALALDGAEIKGCTFLANSIARGMVRATGAHIERLVNLEHATLTTKRGTALSLESARVGDLRLTPISVRGSLSLASTQIGVLVAPDEMAVLAACELDASGWRLGDVRGAIRHDRKAAADWLTSTGSQDSEFVAQPWHELASVYDRNGQPGDARWLRWRAARGVTRTSPPGPKFIRWIYGALTGHGYYPLVAAVWLILAVLITIGVVATHREDFAPTATNRATLKMDVPTGQSAPPITGATPCDQLEDPTTCLNAVLWSFDNVLPGTLSTGQATLWTPNAAQGWSQWVPYALGTLKIFSWILVALLLAGVTGLLRKT